MAALVSIRGQCLRNTISDGKCMKDLSDIKNSDIKNAIDEYIHSERDRAVLLDRLVNGLTFEKLGEKHDLSEIQVKRIVYKLSDDVYRHLGV